MALERTGIVEEGQRRTALYHARKPVEVPRPVLRVKPIFEKGRYIPLSLTRLIALVAKQADTSPEAICGMGRRQGLTDARSCIANLAEEFCPQYSAAAVDDAMLRGQHMCKWYRERHSDRIAAYPEYAALYETCRTDMLAKHRSTVKVGVTVLP